MGPVLIERPIRPPRQIRRDGDLISEIENRLDEQSARGLATAVSRSIRDGVLSAGDQLPPIRELARELALSPTTVSAAWGLLARAGTIRTAGRRGTEVADPAAPRSARYSQVFEQGTTFALDLSTGVPDETLLPSLGRALGALTTAGTPHSYLDDPVLPELRDVLLTTWPYSPPTLTVVDGAMDALDLVIRAELRYGDRVIVEHPTFPPLLDLLENAGADIVGVRLDDEGMEVAGLSAALQMPARALFLQPRAHNPTGVSMSPRRVEALAALVAAHDTLVVEDDSAGLISTAPDMSLGRALPEQTVHIRSFSKSHGPDLRLAAMSGPNELLTRVRHLRQLGQGWSSRLLQRVLLNLLTDITSQREIAVARDAYAARRSTFAEVLAAEGVPLTSGDGLNVWVPVQDEAAALVRLAAQGIGVAPGAPFNVLEDQGHVRVTVGLLGDQIEEVARVVAAAASTGGWGGRSR